MRNEMNITGIYMVEIGGFLVCLMGKKKTRPASHFLGYSWIFQGVKRAIFIFLQVKVITIWVVVLPLKDKLNFLTS